VKANALFGALGKTPARGERSRRRTRTRGESGRFNLEVIFAALIEDAGESGLVSSATRLFSCAEKFLPSKTRLAIGHGSSMSRIFEKSICKCPRCVAKRRIRFLTVLVACIAVSAACVVLIDHREPIADPFLSMKGTLAKEPNLDPDALSNGDSETVSTALAEPGIPAEQQDMGAGQERMARDDFSANSPKPTEYPAPLYGSVNLPVLPSSNPIGQPPVPHTKGWQTAVMGDVPESASRGEAQGGLQPESAKVAAAVKPEPSPDSQANATSWSSAQSYDFARVIRSKIHNIRHRSPARLRFVDVKMRLIALWHQSLARSQRPRSWTGFWNSNEGEGRKLAASPEGNH
jgi:hypothetical protein